MRATRLPPDAEPAGLHAAHDAFLSGQAAPSHVRDLIVESWVRSAAAGVDADSTVAPLDLAEVAQFRDAHPLSPVFPLLYDVLGRAAEACDSVLAIGDAQGRLLWVCGRPSVLRQAERINFVEGAMWDEAHAGTNAPGTALRLDTAVQIRGAEHFARSVQKWSCAAAPIHHPDSKQILGVVDITGGPEIDSPQTMAMVRAAARMAEAELGRLLVVRGAGVSGGSDLRRRPDDQPRRLLVDGLGRTECQIDDGVRTLRLSPRHSELLVILSRHPEGLSSEQLALELYRDDGNLSTLRAEMTRLRALLGADLVESRPYRLRAAAECDWLTVRGHLAAGRLPDAVRSYHGPLLPNSEAPGVVALREQLHAELRNAVARSGSTDLMVAWTRSRWGADDLAMWGRLAARLPASSPLRAITEAEVERLDAQLRW